MKENGAPLAAPSVTVGLPHLPQARLQKPHQFFPFDLFCHGAAEGRLTEYLENELSYVSDHCMMPPYPWGQVVYYDLLMEHIFPQVEGHLAEFGVGQGGMSVFLARLAKRYGRKFLAVDSFEGLPPPDVRKDNPYFMEGDYKAPACDDNFEAFMRYKSAYDVEDNMQVVKAFFCDVEIPSEFDFFAFVHIDSDLYDSVYDTLNKVWDRLNKGGCVAVDDFFHHAQGPARAVADFFRSRKDEEPPLMFVVPTYAVVIIKGRPAAFSTDCAQDEIVVSKVPTKKYSMYAPRALDGNYYSFVLLRKCKPFIQAAEASVLYVTEVYEQALRNGEEADGLLRIKSNAEQFLAFLQYADEAPRSGMDIFRYLTPLEDLFDWTQGSLCGMPGQVRKEIEIQI